MQPFIDCMAKQGVTLPPPGQGPDEQGDDNGSENQGADGGNRQDFDKAREACASLAPPGGFGGDRGPGGERALPSAPANTGSTAPITMTDVAKHSTAADCWSVISGNVYDLTAWIPLHPGGSAVVTSLCGIDGTDAYTSRHQGQREPEQVLARLQVGVLVG
jgi:hypothetical protein